MTGRDANAFWLAGIYGRAIPDWCAGSAPRTWRSDVRRWACSPPWATWAAAPPASPPSPPFSWSRRYAARAPPPQSRRRLAARAPPQQRRRRLAARAQQAAHPPTPLWFNAARNSISYRYIYLGPKIILYKFVFYFFYIKSRSPWGKHFCNFLIWKISLEECKCPDSTGVWHSKSILYYTMEFFYLSFSHKIWKHYLCNGSKQ